MSTNHNSQIAESTKEKSFSYTFFASIAPPQKTLHLNLEVQPPNMDIFFSQLCVPQQRLKFNTNLWRSRAYSKNWRGKEKCSSYFTFCFPPPNSQSQGWGCSIPRLRMLNPKVGDYMIVNPRVGDAQSQSWGL